MYARKNTKYRGKYPERTNDKSISLLKDLHTGEGIKQYVAVSTLRNQHTGKRTMHDMCYVYACAPRVSAWVAGGGLYVDPDKQYWEYLPATSRKSKL